MSVFRLPVGLCDDLTKLTRQFWWGVEKGKRKMAWCAWDNLILPKSHGGMGFRDMYFFNQALLAKQAWRLLDFPHSLCARLLRNKYYPNGNLGILYLMEIPQLCGKASNMVWSWFKRV
jgi:hypothetical protein